MFCVFVFFLVGICKVLDVFWGFPGFVGCFQSVM